MDIRFGNHPDKTRLVIDFTGESDFRAVIDSAGGMVIHLKHKDVIPHNYTVKPPFSDLIIQEDKPFTRLELPLIHPAKIRSAYVIEGNPHRLVIDVTDGVSNGAVHGPLVIDPASLKSDQSAMSESKPIIMIDAGHGGVDPGAVSRGGIFEKDITLSIALITFDLLNKSGRYDARLTRETDQFIRLYDRVKMAREADADLFISIHADSVRGGERVSGASVYTLSPTASDAQTAALAKRENAVDLIGGFDADVADESIQALLINLSMSETMDNSKKLADMLVRGFKDHQVKTIAGPHRHAGFAVLKAPDIPSVLVETGFLSNEDQAKALLDPAYQNAIAQSIFVAVDQYFRQ